MASLKLFSQTSVGINLSGPSRFIEFLLETKDVHDLKIRMRTTVSDTTGKCLNAASGLETTQHPGPVLDFDDMGVIPVSDIDVAYGEMAHGRRPFNVGRIKVRSGRFTGKAPNIDPDDLRSIAGLRRAFGRYVPVRAKCDENFGNHEVYTASLLLDLDAVDAGSLVNMSHATIQLRNPHGGFAFSGNCSVADRINRLMRSRETVILSLNPGYTLTSRTARTKVVLTPVSDGRALDHTLGGTVVRYGAGVQDGDSWGMSSSELCVKADHFHEQIDHFTNFVTKIYIHLPVE